jgi:hypothetical protein
MPADKIGVHTLGWRRFMFRPDFWRMRWKATAMCGTEWTGASVSVAGVATGSWLAPVLTNTQGTRLLLSCHTDRSAAERPDTLQEYG